MLQVLGRTKDVWGSSPTWGSTDGHGSIEFYRQVLLQLPPIVLKAWQTGPDWQFLGAHGAPAPVTAPPVSSWSPPWPHQAIPAETKWRITRCLTSLGMARKISLRLWGDRVRTSSSSATSARVWRIPIMQEHKTSEETMAKGFRIHSKF